MPIPARSWPRPSTSRRRPTRQPLVSSAGAASPDSRSRHSISASPLSPSPPAAKSAKPNCASWPAWENWNPCRETHRPGHAPFIHGSDWKTRHGGSLRQRRVAGGGHAGARRVPRNRGRALPEALLRGQGRIGRHHHRCGSSGAGAGKRHPRSPCRGGACRRPQGSLRRRSAPGRNRADEGLPRAGRGRSGALSGQAWRPAGQAMTALEFWFDFHSPWAYLAATRIEGLAARHALSVRWRPLHLPRLNEAIKGRRPLEENPAFVAWYRQDLQDWAELCGVRIRYHPDYPLRPARALRAALRADEFGAVAAFSLAVFGAYWSEHRDISDL